MIGWIILGVVVVITLFVISLFNGLIRLKNEVGNSWAQINVQLKRRFDLIPNLIETVKGYAKHEKELLTKITEARSAVMSAQSVEGKAKASGELSNTLKSLFAVAENYPDLKANTNFLQLQEELTGTENKIAYSRQHYNDVVMIFNNNIEVFPNNMIAGVLGFKQKDLFAVPDAERKPVKVKF